MFPVWLQKERTELDTTIERREIGYKPFKLEEMGDCSAIFP